MNARRKRRRQKRRARNRSPQRPLATRLVLERLEERWLLDTQGLDPSCPGEDDPIVAPLVVVLDEGPTDLVLSLQADHVRLHDILSSIEIAAAPIATTSEVIITAADDVDDTLTIDFSGGEWTLPVTFHGGDAGFDTLAMRGGAFSSVVYTAESPDSGTISLDGLMVTYTGLEPIVDDSDVDNLVFTATNAADQIRILNDDVLLGQMEIRSQNGTFENHFFLNPAESLTVNASSGDDTITIESLDPEFNAVIVINGNFGNDTLDLAGRTAVQNSDGTVGFLDNGRTINVARTSVEQLQSGVLIVEEGIPTWVEHGPFPIAGPDIEDPSAGAIHALAIHQHDPNLIFVGSVNGGVWRTTDGGDHWEPLTDQFPSLSIGAVTIAAWDADGNLVDQNTDPDKLVVFAGTGAFSASRRRGGAAIGVLRSENGGNTWELLPSTEMVGLPVSAIATSRVDGKDVVVVATHGKGGSVRNSEGKIKGKLFKKGGIFRSEDGGDSFNKQTLVQPPDDFSDFTIPPSSATDVVVDPGDASRFYAAVRGGGVFRSDNGGKDWMKINGSGVNTLDLTGDAIDNDGSGMMGDDGETAEGALRIRLAIRPGNTNTVYAALIGNRNEQLMGVFSSDDQGSNWRPLGTVPAPIPGGMPRPPAQQPQVSQGGQADIHFAIAADEDGNVYIAGDRGQGRIHHWDPGAIRWELIVDTIPIAGGAANGTAPHSDVRQMVVDSNGNLAAVTDGGIYRLLDPTNTPPLPPPEEGRRWFNLNGDLRTTEIIAITYDPLNNALFGGTQDNGSPEQPSPNDGVNNDMDLETDEPDEQLAWTDIVIRNVDWDRDGNVEARLLAGDGNTALAIPLDTDQDDVFDQTLRFTMSNDIETLATRLFGSDGQATAGTDAVPSFRRVNALGIAVPGDPDFRGLTNLDRMKFTGANAIFKVIPYALNAVDDAQQRMLIGLTSLYESTDRLTSVREVVRANARENVFTSVAYGGMKNGQPNLGVVYAARGNEIHIRTSAQGDFKAEKIKGVLRITDIVLDPDNYDVAYAVADSRVFKRVGNDDWDPISQRLIDFDFQTIEFVRAEDIGGTEDVLLVGATNGVYRAFNPKKSVAWTEFGRNLPNALVSDLSFENIDPSLFENPRNLSRDDILIAGTLGRGVWTVPSADDALSKTATLQIAGTAGDDVVRIARNVDNESLIDIFIGTSSDASLTVPLASVFEIRFSGNQGDDQLTVDSTLGSINLLGGIFFDGGTGDETNGDRLVLEGKKAVDKDDVTVDGNPGIQIEDADSAFPQVVVRQNVEDVDDNVPEAGFFEKLRAGLRQFFVDLGILSDPDEEEAEGAENEMALLRGSLPRALRGVRAGDQDPVTDPKEEGQQTLEGAGLDEPGFQRIIEGGENGFSLLDIGSIIVTPEELRDRFDALDNIDGNVSFIEQGSLQRFDLQIVQTLDGAADFDLGTELFGGNVDLDGFMEINAEVVLNLAFGVDESGFFIDTSGPEPELLFRNISLEGDLDAGGQFGFLDVSLSAPELTIDDQVQAALNLTAPSPDGLLRLSDLVGDITNLELPNLGRLVVTGNPTEDDLVFTTTLEAAALLPNLEAPFDLGSAEVTFRWADITTIESVEVEFSAGAGEDLANFLKVNSNELRDQLGVLRTNISALGVDLPLVNKTLDQLVGVVDAFNDKIVDPLTTPVQGTARFATAQHLADQLSTSLGVAPEEFNVGYESSSKELTYDVSFSESFQGDEAIDFGFDLLDGFTDLDLSAMASAGAAVDFKLTFGVDLADVAAGASPLDFFFIKDVSATGTIDLTAADIDAAARFGLLDLLVVDGSGEAHPSISLSLKDPGTNVADDRIDLRELIDALTSDPASVVGAPNISGIAQFTLPIAVPFLGINPGPDTTIVVTIDDLSDPTNVQFAPDPITSLPALADLTNFDNLSALALQQLLVQLRNWLDQARGSSVFATDLPLTDRTLGDVIDVGAAFFDSVVGVLGQPATGGERLGPGRRQADRRRESVAERQRQHRPQPVDSSQPNGRQHESQRSGKRRSRSACIRIAGRGLAGGTRRRGAPRGADDLRRDR